MNKLRSGMTLCLLALLSNLPLISLQAQDWVPLRSGETYAFHAKPDTWYMGALQFLRADSVRWTGTDSVYYFPVTIRYDDFIGYTNERSPWWIGDSLRIAPNGDMTFYNELGEPIFLSGNRQPGTTYVMHEDSLGTQVHATVTGSSEFEFVGMTDSLYRITLSVTDSNGLPLTHPANGFQIELSKRFGFRKTCTFWSFPYFTDWTDTLTLSGFDGDIAVGQQVLTAKQLFALSVGDQFQYREVRTSWPNDPYTSDLYMEILSIQTNGNTVTLQIETGTRGAHGYTSGNGPIAVDTIIQTLNLADPDWNTLPGTSIEKTGGYYPVGQDTLREAGQPDLPYLLLERYAWTGGIQFDFIFNDLSGGPYSWYKGTPLPCYGYYDADAGGFSRNLVYAGKTNGFTWGAPTIEIPQEGYFWSVYPNPCADQLNLRFYQVDSSGWVHLEFYDMLGRPVKKQALWSPGGITERTIDLSALPPGEYFVRFYRRGTLTTYTKRLIKSE